MELADLIRRERESAALSLRALAEACHVDPAYLSRVERGQVPPSEKLLSRLSETLNVSEERLFLSAGRVPPDLHASIMSDPEGVLLRAGEHLKSGEPSPKSVVAYGGRRAIEQDGFPFEWISDIAEAESWRKEIYRPCYHLHKWWAQRLGSVFRAALIGTFAPRGSDILSMYYEPSQVPNAVVLDPFMGSGTTVGEALKLGMRAVGRDINPVARNAVSAALSTYDPAEVRRTYRAILRDVRKELTPFYRTVLPDGREVEVAYFFWVKFLPCPECGDRVDLFSSYVFSRHAYPKRQPLARIICPDCGGVSEGRYDSSSHDCPSCRTTFDPQSGPARRSKATCNACATSFQIASTARASGHPPRERLFAKIVMSDDGVRQYLPATDVDKVRYAQAERRLGELPGILPAAEISEGYNTNQVINYGYKHWSQMFNARQSLSLGLLGRRISQISDPSLRNLFLMAFSGLLEFQNTFTSFKGEGTGAVRHMFAHHILKPERLPFEANPLSEKGSGSFPGIFRRRVLRAVEYARDPFDVAIYRSPKKRKKTEKVYGLSAPMACKPAESYREFLAEGRRAYLSVGDSSATDLPDNSVDAVVTDPPFFDNVHYSELADFFHVWQRHLGVDGAGSLETTRSDREVQHGDVEEFSSRLSDVWRECARVLVPHGLLVFSYHHSRGEGWSSLLRSLSSADFGVTAAHPVKSELSVASPKAQAKSPVDLDILFCCRRRENLASSRPKTEDQILVAVQETASRQVDRFNTAGRKLSRNDVLVVTAAQLVRLLSWLPPEEEEGPARSRQFSGLFVQLEPFMQELWSSQEVASAPSFPIEAPGMQLSLV
jgi:putative DNA methylase